MSLEVSLDFGMPLSICWVFSGVSVSCPSSRVDGDGLGTD
jgi:hypothetical protein